MTENKGYLTAACILGALIVLSGIVVLASLPKPVECPNCPICPECPKPVVITNTTYVETEVTPDYKDIIVQALLDEVKADKDFRTCDGELYKASEITLKKVYDGFIVTENEDGDSSIDNVKVKLNYDDGECYKTFNCGLNQEKEIVC